MSLSRLAVLVVLAVLAVLAVLLTACSGDPPPLDGLPLVDAAAPDSQAARDAASPDLLHDLSAAADAPAPDTSAPLPAPVVYGAHANPGNQVCKHLHPPATTPCYKHSLKWLVDIYGIELTRAPAAEVAKAGAVYRLVELAEREGPVAIEIWVVDAAGAILANTPVTVCYPVTKGTAGPACTANMIPLKVKAQGHADFTMTASGYIGCGQLGPYAAWISEPGVPSDRVYGLGMLAMTNHRHMNLLFQRVTAGKPAKDATVCPLQE